MVKSVTPLNELYLADHISYLKKNDHIYFFNEFSIPKIHKWVPELGFTDKHIPFLYMTYYNNLWDKFMNKDPKTKALYDQELLDTIKTKIQEYEATPQKRVINTSVKNIARHISIQDEDKNEMINQYLKEVKKNLL